MEHRTVTVTNTQEPILKVWIYRGSGKTKWWVQRYTASGMTGTWGMPRTWMLREETFVE